ncbi:hypothetical protein OIU74_015639 [Salix koriyanagi]|uniref:Uncharacterized protein n=1 Tax=Salix koriyanagi TaxID=2511006 RepID=A0A9Q0PMF9_9ROSI|nr:hypothetical protein OIU74_015639 [Salix koriyanagi]
MDSLIGGEILLTDENVAPAIPMADAPETGLGTEPADQPFEMDMNNISSSLMRDVELSSGTEKMTWELMQSVSERGSSSKWPVDRSMPSSSKNIIVTEGSDRAEDLEMQGQLLLDDELSWMDNLIGGEILLTNGNVAPGTLMPDAPETGLGTEPTGQPFEMDMNNISSSLIRDVEFSSGSEKMTWELIQRDGYLDWWGA